MLAKQGPVYLGVENERFIMFHDDYYLKHQIIEIVEKLVFIKNGCKMSQITFIENTIRDGIGVVYTRKYRKYFNEPCIEISVADVHGIWELFGKR